MKTTCARHETRQLLKALDSEKSRFEALHRLSLKRFDRRLARIQSSCWHDWESGMGPGQRCLVCGKTEV